MVATEPPRDKPTRFHLNRKRIPRSYTDPIPLLLGDEPPELVDILTANKELITSFKRPGPRCSIYNHRVADATSHIISNVIKIIELVDQNTAFHLQASFGLVLKNNLTNKFWCILYFSLKY